ncbi:MAG: hypothetical protein HY647_06140 [Acidobacteria bacterium]|nr:hypothetical protein [Acidobacteriota bacterium]
MERRRPNRTGLLALVLVVVAWQVGCQQAATPPAEESAAGEPAQQPQASAPSTPSPEPKPAARPPAAAPSASSSRPAAPATAPAPAVPAPPAPRMANLEAGTALRVRTTNALSTKTQKTGDLFTATLEEPLVQGDWVIAPKGSELEGRIVESDPGGRVKGVASLAVALAHLRLPDGQEIDLKTNTLTVEAKSTEGKDAAKIAIGTGVGAAIGAIAGGGKGAGIGAATGAGAGTATVLATRGDPAEISSETVLSFELTAPVHVMEKK